MSVTHCECIYIIFKQTKYLFQESGHVCRGCYEALERQYQRKRKSQSPTSVTPDQKKGRSVDFQPLSTSTPATVGTKDKARQKLFTTTKINSLWKDTKILKIAQAIKNSKYASAFRQILARGESAKRQFNDVVQGLISRQMRQYNKCNKFPEFKDLESIAEFELESAMNDIRIGIPTFAAAMTGAFTPRRFQKAMRN